MSLISPHDAAKDTCDAFHKVSTSVTVIFDHFQSAMNHILPKLGREEQSQVIAAIHQFSKFLMKMQEFISCTLVGVKYAETLEHLCTAIPTETIQSILEQVESLLEKFLALNIMIQAKIKEETSLYSFRNMMLGKFLFLFEYPNVLYMFHYNFSP